MEESAPNQHHLARISMLRTKARHLMTVATHESMQKQAIRALRDLEEALMWHHSHNIGQHPLLLPLAQAAVEFAAIRLTAIERALADYGPDVADIGEMPSG